MPVEIHSSERITSLEDLLRLVRTPVRRAGYFRVFRGERNSRFITRPSVFRKRALIENERNLVRQLIALHPTEFKDDTSMLERLVRMQHYSLPTRLLDVTLNPLASLYFSTDTFRSGGEYRDGALLIFEGPETLERYYDSDTLSCLTNLANLSQIEKDEICASSPDETLERFNALPSVRRLVQFVKWEKPYFENAVCREDLMRTFLVRPKMSNRRMIAQTSLFLAVGLTSPQRPDFGEIQVRKLIVPADSKAPLREQLEELAINASTLFPELEKASEYLASRFTQTAERP